MTVSTGCALRGVTAVRAAAALVVPFATPLFAQGRDIPKQPYTMAGKSPVYAPNGIAATSQPLATSAALKCWTTVVTQLMRQ